MLRLDVSDGLVTSATYPDALNRLWSALECPHSGDVLLSAQRGFEFLDGPIRRVATPDVPIAFSPTLEQALLPQVSDIRETCRELLAY